MPLETRETAEQRNWFVVGKSLAFAVGVPVGVGAGVLVGAVFEVTHIHHSAAWGLIAGLIIGTGSGLGYAWRVTRPTGDYRWVHRELTHDSNRDWSAVVMALNIKAADHHYLLARREEDYVTYAPTLVRPVAVGPLTVSGEYLSAVVARVTATEIAITGPRYMVGEFENAIRARVNALEAS